jgi:hypothetical protein
MALYSEGKYEDKLEEARSYLSIGQFLAKILEDKIPNFDGEKVIGWEVKHKFRYKSRGGMDSICDCRYILSSDFKKVLLQEDLDDKVTKDTHEIIDYAVKGELSKSLNINF